MSLLFEGKKRKKYMVTQSVTAPGDTNVSDVTGFVEQVW